MKTLMMKLMMRLKTRRGVRVVSCEDALSRLFEYLDGELDQISERELGEHFRICRHCYPKLQFERSFMEALHRVRQGETAPVELKRRITEALRAEGPAL
jgi:anti-sigma factor (TIGR02949 family)